MKIIWPNENYYDNLFNIRMLIDSRLDEIAHFGQYVFAVGLSTSICGCLATFLFTVINITIKYNYADNNQTIFNLLANLGFELILCLFANLLILLVSIGILWYSNWIFIKSFENYRKEFNKTTDKNVLIMRSGGTKTIYFVNAIIYSTIQLNIISGDAIERLLLSSHDENDVDDVDNSF